MHMDIEGTVKAMHEWLKEQTDDLPDVDQWLEKEKIIKRMLEQGTSVKDIVEQTGISMSKVYSVRNGG